MSILYCFYGDDFTGSTDVLQQLAAGDVPAVLFLRQPTQADLDRFPNAIAVGIAGDSRSRTPEWMTDHLPKQFEDIRRLGARVNHYKVCSTFDSGVTVGSIGRVLELGLKAFPETPCLPVLAAAPLLGRYVCFGNLFARTPSGEVARIDRHPMRHHPVTPMDEADLRKHLQRQTALPIGSAELPLLLAGGEAPQSLHQGGVLLFDGLDERTQSVSGRWLWEVSAKSTLFAVASSGLTAALVGCWREAGIISATRERWQAAGTNDSSLAPLLVVSGSCSVATATQIRWALANGFTGFEVTLKRQRDVEFSGCLADSIAAALLEGRSVVVYTALGEATSTEFGGATLGEYLGDLARTVLERHPATRLLLCGGDTSSHAVRRLGIDALTWLADACPGAPLCLAHGGDGAVRDLQLVLKGGQMGGPAFFDDVRRIRIARRREAQ